MILFGVNFNAYYYIIYRHFKKAFKMEEVRCYFAIILIATAIIFANILDRCVSIFDALTKSVFQVASLITSTGFSSTDFNLWPQICRTVLVLIMFIGACAGSTGGGIKVSRVIVLFKTMIKELHSYIHPKSIRKVNLDGKPVEHEIVRSINVYIVTFVIIFASSVFMVAFDGKDLVTNFTAVLTTINNMGPGLAEVGPTGNFSNFSVFSKFVFMFDMLAGRLELFPLLILFHPSAWKDLISKRAEARKF
jgi:trk system potassium uptake protein TrkH